MISVLKKNCSSQCYTSDLLDFIQSDNTHISVGGRIGIITDDGPTSAYTQDKDIIKKGSLFYGIELIGLYKKNHRMSIPVYYGSSFISKSIGYYNGEEYKDIQSSWLMIDFIYAFGYPLKIFFPYIGLGLGGHFTYHEYQHKYEFDNVFNSTSESYLYLMYNFIIGLDTFFYKTISLNTAIRIMYGGTPPSVGGISPIFLTIGLSSELL